MTPELWARIKEVFHKALDLNASERSGYIAKVCRGDPEVRVHVERLLAQSELAGDFLAKPLLSTLTFRPDPLGSKTTLAQGEILSGRFRIVRFIAKGGMGEVYEAEDTVLHDPVAVKTIRPDIAGDSTMSALFQREVQAAKRITHPNVCRIHDLHFHSGNENGEPTMFITMELVRGITISHRLRKARRFRPAEVLPIVEQLSAALNEAHRVGVSHGDFKSGNILLESSDGAIRAVVTDFGLARVLSDERFSSLMAPGPLLGTPVYMAPEQFEGGQPSPEADIYAFGVVLYEAISGELPFSGSFHEIRAAKLHDSPKPLRDTLGDLPPIWDSVIMKCLERDPAKRFSHASEVFEALAREHRSAPVIQIAAVEPERKQPRQFIRWAAAVFLLMLLIGLALTTFRYKIPQAASHWYDEGLRALRQGTYYTALRCFDQATAADPTFQLAHARAAEAASYLDYQDKAGAELLRVTPPSIFRLPSRDELRLRAIYDTVSRKYAAAIESYRLLAFISPRAETPDILLDIGRNYEAAGDIRKAVETYKQVEADDHDNAAAALRLGSLYRRLRDVNDAISELSKAEQVYRTVGNQEGLTEVLYEKGVLLGKTGKALEASGIFDQAYQHAEESHNDYAKIRIELQKSFLSYIAGDFAGGEQQAQDAIELARRSGLDLLGASSLIDLGNALLLQNDLKRADQYLSDAIQIAKRHESPRVQARALVALASVRLKQGDTQHAVEYSKEALADYIRYGYKGEAARTAAATALSLIGDGAIDDALQLVSRVLQSTPGNEDPEAAALLHVVYGLALNERNNYPAALTNFLDSIEGFKRSRSLQQLGYAYVDAAEAYSHVGDYGNAEKFFRFALQSASGAGGSALASFTAVYRADMLISQQRWREADEQLKQVDAGSLDPEGKADLMRIKCLISVGSGRAREGLQQCSAAVDAAASLRKPQPHILAAIALAAAQLASGEATQAEETAQAAAEEAKQAGLDEPEFRALAVCTKALRAQGRSVEADKDAARTQAVFKNFMTPWAGEFRRSYLKRPDVVAALDAVKPSSGHGGSI